MSSDTRSEQHRFCSGYVYDISRCGRLTDCVRGKQGLIRYILIQCMTTLYILMASLRIETLQKPFVGGRRLRTAFYTMLCNRVNGSVLCNHKVARAHQNVPFPCSHLLLPDNSQLPRTLPPTSSPELTSAPISSYSTRL